ncbi:MAG: 4Fe-4S binding protein [Planctomycetes bacterium]|nr:4Fe-4S binding protein [Planctomycetota bacterium]
MPTVATATTVAGAVDRCERALFAQCVRCSACVQSCPTGVLEFGRINRTTGQVIARDRLAASPVLMAEATVQGRRIPSA